MARLTLEQEMSSSDVGWQVYRLRQTLQLLRSASAQDDAELWSVMGGTCIAVSVEA